MNVNIESPSGLKRKVTIEVESDEIKRELDRSYNELRRTVVMRGFRPGHAPRNLLERFFGDQVRGEVIQRLVKEYTEKALEESNLRPVVEPEIVTEETDLPKTLKFSAVFDLKPEIVIKDYENFKIPGETIEVGDKEVDETLERLRERQATLKKIEERRTVAEGDVAVVTIEAFEGGNPIPQTKGEDRLLEVSKRNLAHGLDQILIGAELGNEIRAIRSYPAEYEQKELAGKTVEWRASVKEIYQRQLPLLDDDFARDQGDCQNLQELRERIRNDLVGQAHAEADARASQALLDLILERNPIEVPESLAERDRRAMELEYAATLRGAGIPEEQIAARVREGAEEFKTRSEKQARTTLLLEALANQEKVEINDDELAERIGLIARRSAGRGGERPADFYAREENREALRQSMRRQKALSQLLARAKSGAQAP